MSNVAIQGYVVLGATGQRINSDRIIISEAASQDERFTKVWPFIVKTFTRFDKMDTLTIERDGASFTYQTKFLVTAGLTTEETDDEPTIDDEEFLNSVNIDNPELILEHLGE